jgi:hypothetical protein
MFYNIVLMTKKHIFASFGNWALQGYLWRGSLHDEDTMQKILVLSGIFIFQIFKLLSIGISGLLKAVYIHATENTAFPIRCQLNTSDPCKNWMDPDGVTSHPMMSRSNEASSE